MSIQLLRQVKAELAKLNIQVTTEYEAKIVRLIDLYAQADVPGIVHKIVFDVKQEKGVA